MSGSNAYGAEKSLTPVTMDHEWDGYMHRKHDYGPQPTLVRYASSTLLTRGAEAVAFLMFWCFVCWTCRVCSGTIGRR